MEKRRNTLLFKHGMSILSFGETIAISIAAVEHGSELVIWSENKWQVFSWGTNTSNIVDFKNMMDFCVRSLMKDTAKFCVVCGSNMIEGNRFCTNCGTQLVFD